MRDPRNAAARSPKCGCAIPKMQLHNLIPEMQLHDPQLHNPQNAAARLHDATFLMGYELKIVINHAAVQWDCVAAKYNKSNM